MSVIDSISSAATPAIPEATTKRASGPSANPFADHAGALFREADQLQKDAEHQAGELAAGRGSTVETMVALSKADLSLRLVVSLRNRAVQAYETLMRMQV